MSTQVLQTRDQMVVNRLTSLLPPEVDKLERALRKVHDKKIFKNRREAKKAEAKRHTG